MDDQVITQEDWAAVAKEREQSPQDVASQEVTPPPEPQQVEQAPVAPQAEETVDPYANLSPEVQAKLKRLDELSAVMPGLVDELKQAKGRIGALQSQWDKVRQNVEAPSQKQVAAAAKDPEKWAALKQDFPEWGDAISEFVETKLGSVTGKASGPSAEEIEQLVSQRTEAATSTLRRQLNETLVSVAHKGWKNDVKTPEFAAWYAAQRPEVQALAGSEDGLDAIQMLDLYTEHRKKPVQAVQDQRQQRLAAAAVTPTKQATTNVVTKTFEDMSPAEQWEYIARERAKAAAG